MLNDDQIKDSRPQALASACARCAIAVAGEAVTEPSVYALARGFENAARRGAKEFGCDPEADVAIAVEFLACTADEVPLDMAQAWFTARLDLLLELMQPSIRLSEEAGAFLPMLERGLKRIVETFSADEPRRKLERAQARKVKERAESLALARFAQDQHKVAEEKLRSAPAIGQPILDEIKEIPSHWVKSSDYEGEWMDGHFHDEVLAAKTHVRPGFPTFIVHRAGSKMTFQCVIRWGGGLLAAKLMSGAQLSPKSAFDAVMTVYRACTDEPLRPEKPWLWQVQAALQARYPKTAPRATAVEMVNTIEVGPPRYVCKVTFFEIGQQQVHRSSTPRESLTAAFEEALVRCLEFATANQVNLPQRRTLLERIADEGLSKGALEYPSAPNGKHSCRLRWQALDGKTLAVQSDLSESREDAFASALKKAVAREESRELDWRETVKTNLARLGIRADTISVKFAEAQGDGGAKRYTCKVAWGLPETYIHETQPYPTMRTVVLAAIQGVESTLAKLKSARDLTGLARRAVRAANGQTPQPQQSQTQIREIMGLIEGVRPRWLEERQRLLAKTARSVDEASRLRDLSAYLAFLDPVRRGEFEPRLAETIFGQMLKEATTALSNDCGHVNTLDDLHFLRTIAASKVSKPGDPLKLTVEFKEMCASKGRTPETVLAHLVNRNLVNRHRENQLTIADAGFRLLLKYIGPRGMASGGSLSDTATAKLAQLKSTRD